jgi:hypothetical protein
MNYTFEMASAVMIYIRNFTKISSNIEVILRLLFQKFEKP